MPKHEKPKLFKIRCTEEARKFGIAAFTLKELIQKGCKLFQLLERKTHCCLYEDGTILTDEYFQRLPDNTELVLFSDGQSWNKLVYELGRVLGTDAHADDLISAARKLQTDEISAKWQKIVCDFLCNMKDNADMENRDDDSDWFEGIDTRFKTKSSYMKYNCEQRIRGYLKEVGSSCKLCSTGHTPMYCLIVCICLQVQGHAQTIKNAKQKREYDKVVASLAEKLKSAHYHGTYFDRTEKERHRLCTTEGWFSCQGAFDQDKCKLLHSINPYCNRENRILFSTWNLDH
ncbi:hypothetical protein P4O66_022821, partial [Electrophorus voltai]